MKTSLLEVIYQVSIDKLRNHPFTSVLQPFPNGMSTALPGGFLIRDQKTPDLGGVWSLMKNPPE